MSSFALVSASDKWFVRCYSISGCSNATRSPGIGGQKGICGSEVTADDTSLLSQQRDVWRGTTSFSQPSRPLQLPARCSYGGRLRPGSSPALGAASVGVYQANFVRSSRTRISTTPSHHRRVGDPDPNGADSQLYPRMIAYPAMPRRFAALIGIIHAPHQIAIAVMTDFSAFYSGISPDVAGYDRRHRVPAG